MELFNTENKEEALVTCALFTKRRSTLYRDLGTNLLSIPRYRAVSDNISLFLDIESGLSQIKNSLALEKVDLDIDSIREVKNITIKATKKEVKLG